jgi:excisionase family DNA binding protein
MLIEKTFCTTRQAADLLGISVGTVQFWVDSGLLSAWKTPGGHRRVTRASINNLLYGAKDKLADLQSQPSAIPFAPIAPIADNLSAKLAVERKPSEAKRLKILMLEGDGALRLRYETAFKKWPITPEVTVVGNAKDGLAAFERDPVDLLIADLDTTGLNALELVSSLKQIPGHEDLCLVLVGGLTQNIVMLPKPLPLGKLLLLARKVAKNKVSKLTLSETVSKRQRA